MAVLNKKWEAASKIAPSDAVVTGEEAKAKDEPKAEADQPMMIYVTDGSEAEGYDKIEKVIFKDNKVCIGMWAFRCIKMSPDDVENDPLLSGKGKEMPRFMFVAHDYSDVKVIEGNKLKTKEVYNAMKKFAGKAYATKFDKNVKATLKVLIEFDKINNAKKVIAEKEKRLGADISKGEAKKMAKEREELDARQKKADEQWAALKTFVKKGSKAA
jgi:hypothetical protein